jgi:hypothetical protein
VRVGPAAAEPNKSLGAARATRIPDRQFHFRSNDSIVRRNSHVTMVASCLDRLTKEDEAAWIVVTSPVTRLMYSGRQFSSC